MAIKQNLKISEARIIILLSQVPNELKHAGAISAKLDIDFSYTVKILAEMGVKGWLRKDLEGCKRFYFLTNKSPTEAAKKLLTE